MPEQTLRIVFGRKPNGDRSLFLNYRQLRHASVAGFDVNLQFVTQEGKPAYSVVLTFDREASGRDYHQRIQKAEIQEIICEKPIIKMRAIAMPDQLESGPVYACGLTKAEEVDLERTHVKAARGTWVSRKYHQGPG